MSTPPTLDGAAGTPPELYREARWYVCYTRARHEKRVATTLDDRGLESFLPLIPKLRSWSDRKKIVRFPMFPGYVFARFTLSEQHRVLSVPGVATLVRLNGHPSPIPADDIENIRLFESALESSDVDPRPARFLDEGQPVRIIAGPLQGVRGVVVESRGRGRVLVGLSTIRQGLEVDVPDEHVEPMRAA